MSTKPKTIGAYADCVQIMELALKSAGARLPFDHRGRAVSFRQRCYRARQLLQRAEDSRFDSIYIQIEPLTGPKDSPAELIFLLRAASTDMLSRIKTLDGQPIEDSEELESEAEAFARSLGLR
jgi:hypothetical protein